MALALQPTRMMPVVTEMKRVLKKVLRLAIAIGRSHVRPACARRDARHPRRRYCGPDGRSTMSGRPTDAQRLIQFVCEHGAFRSRIAAAYFNTAPPAGWRACSAGREPQATVSPALDALLAGTSALDALERDAPSGIRAGAERTIAIDSDAPADEHWVLANRNPDASLRDELRDRVTALRAALASAG